jgi:hypothetical protein
MAKLVGGNNVNDILGGWGDGKQNFTVVVNPASQFTDPVTNQTAYGEAQYNYTQTSPLQYLQFSPDETRVYQSAVPLNTNPQQVNSTGVFFAPDRMQSAKIQWVGTVPQTTWSHVKLPLPTVFPFNTTNARHTAYKQKKIKFHVKRRKQ